jgi:hypothetical protein
VISANSVPKIQAKGKKIRDAVNNEDHPAGSRSAADSETRLPTARLIATPAGIGRRFGRIRL